MSELYQSRSKKAAGTPSSAEEYNRSTAKRLFSSVFSIVPLFSVRLITIKKLATSNSFSNLHVSKDSLKIQRFFRTCTQKWEMKVCFRPINFPSSAFFSKISNLRIGLIPPNQNFQGVGQWQCSWKRETWERWHLNSVNWAKWCWQLTKEQPTYFSIVWQTPTYVWNWLAVWGWKWTIFN